MTTKATCQHTGGFFIRCADSIADASNGNHYWECSDCGQQFVERERLIRITEVVPAPFGSRKP